MSSQRRERCAGARGREEDGDGAGSGLQVGRAGGTLAQAWSTRGERTALLVTEEQRQRQVHGDVQDGNTRGSGEGGRGNRPKRGGSSRPASVPGNGGGGHSSGSELSHPWRTSHGAQRERGKCRLQSNLSLYACMPDHSKPIHDGTSSGEEGDQLVHVEQLFTFSTSIQFLQ